jgi:type I restriction enzyme, S subunit
MIDLEWKSRKLGEVITLQRGFDLPKSKRKKGNIPIISSSGTDGYHSESKVKGPGVVTGRYGTLGKVFFIKEDFWPLNTTLYVKDFKENDPKFISYFLFTLNLANQNTAGAVPGLNRNALHLINVEIPIIDIQQKIASILSSYDDLIENNTRRIDILEQMAKLVYEEWFVKFRFPGHENVKMVPSEFGKIPEEWKVRKVSEMLKRLKAGNKYTQDNVLEEGLFLVIDQSDKEILGFHNNVADHSASLKNPIMIFGDHTCKLRILIEPFSIGPNVVPFVSKIYPETFVFFLIKNLVQTKEYKRHWNELQAKKVVLPDIALAREFVNRVNPLFKQITLLEHKNQNLRKTRDLLLPKLISGEIDVSDLDISIRNEYQKS